MLFLKDENTTFWLNFMIEVVFASLYTIRKALLLVASFIRIYRVAEVYMTLDTMRVLLNKALASRKTPHMECYMKVASLLSPGKDCKARTS